MRSAGREKGESCPDQSAGHLWRVATFLRTSRVPRLGETRGSSISRSRGMERNKDLVDYLVGVMVLAVILIVGLAVLGNQLANVLHPA